MYTGSIYTCRRLLGMGLAQWLHVVQWSEHSAFSPPSIEFLFKLSCCLATYTSTFTIPGGRIGQLLTQPFCLIIYLAALEYVAVRQNLGAAVKQARKLDFLGPGSKLGQGYSIGLRLDTRHTGCHDNKQCLSISDIPSDPPFAGWAHIFSRPTRLPANCITVLKNPHYTITHQRLFFIACSTCKLLTNAVQTPQTHSCRLIEPRSNAHAYRLSFQFCEYRPYQRKLRNLEIAGRHMQVDICYVIDLIPPLSMSSRIHATNISAFQPWYLLL